MPVHTFVDSNGVDLISGGLQATVAGPSVGTPGQGGLSRNYFVHACCWLGSSVGAAGWVDTLNGAVNVSGSLYTVSLGGSSETFTLSGSTYTSNQGAGSTLTKSGSTYTYTLRDGSVAVYSTTVGSTVYIASLSHPSGEALTYYGQSVGSPAYYRINSIVSNRGYQIKYIYTNNTGSIGFIIPTSVQLINNSVDYCSTGDSPCTGLTQSWPTSSINSLFAKPVWQTTVTDSVGNATGYTPTESPFTMFVQKPSGQTLSYTFDSAAAGHVTDVSNAVTFWAYAYSLSGTTLTVTATDPLGHTRAVVSNQTTLTVTSDTDGLGRTTSYLYDGYGRTTQVTYPEGNETQYTYDARGNITQVVQVPKPGSGLANITTSANYDATCTLTYKCNKPNTTTNAVGQITSYTYDTTAGYGGLLSITYPAGAGGVQPQTRFSYSQIPTYAKNSSGTLVQVGSIWQLTGTSTCASGTAPSCVGTSAETKSTIAYSGSSNGQPTSITSAAGDGSLSATVTTTYDVFGNVQSVQGPLGAAQTVLYSYNANRQLTGVIGPDPDGSGPLLYRASQTTYNSDSLPTLIAQGTVTSQSSSAWSSFSALLQTAITYDSLDRVATQSSAGGGTTVSLAQFSYDNANRQTCAAVRMNPAAFGSLPASACTQGTAGTDGPDRITAFSYDNANELTQTTVGYGSSTPVNEQTLTYGANGEVATAADGNNNLTTYGYDGFVRRTMTYYPLPGGGGSSTSDYELLTLDAGSRITQDRRRDGTTVSLGYDNLNNLTTGPRGEAYAYDNFSRMLTASLSGKTDSFAYDALGRKTSETSPLGTMSYQYDLAGRRTRMTWPDGLYAAYVYDGVNELTAVEENGATSGIGLLVSNTYDNLGHLTQASRGNGVTTTASFDTIGRLSGYAHAYPGGASNQSVTLTLGPNGQIDSRAGSNSSYDWAAGTPVTHYYAINGQNQATQNATVSGTLNLTYDGRGNLNNDGTNAYSYDVLNNLLTMNASATLSYDALGRLASTVSSSTTQFAYDGGQAIGEYDGSGNLLRRYVPGAGVWYEGTAEADRRWMLPDERGSVIAVANASGAADAINTYDEYGAPASSNLGRFQYTGQMWVPEVGLYHYNARAYSPTLGRFMQTDPSGFNGGMNLYRYVGDDPINGSDPSGLEPVVSPVTVTGARPTCLCDDLTGGGSDFADFGYGGGTISGLGLAIKFNVVGNTTANKSTDYVGDTAQIDGDEVIVTAAYRSGSFTSIDTSGFAALGFGGGGGQDDEPQSNGRNCSVAPATAGQYAAATAESVAMTAEFFSGLGNASPTFGPDSATSQVMGQSAGVQAALGQYQSTGATSGLYSFGLSGLAQAGANPVAQFVGSFRWSISGNILSVTNTSSFKSLAYDHGPQWQRSQFAPMGNTHQTYNIRIGCH